MDNSKNKYWFQRNTKKTLFCILTVLFLTVDLSLGIFFIPDIEGIPHHYYHHDLKKNYHGNLRWGPMYYEIYTNSLGFKDSRYGDVTLSSKKYRFLILGDSFGEGIGVPYGKTFVGLVEKKLNLSMYEILNASVKSYSPKLYNLKTRYLIEEIGLHFNELYVFIDISDISDEIFWYRVKPVRKFSPSHMLKVLNSFLFNNFYSYNKLGEKIVRSLVGYVYTMKRIIKKVLRYSETVLLNDPLVRAQNKKNEFEPLHVNAIQNTRKDYNKKSDKEEYINMHLFKEHFYEDRAKWTYDEEIYQKWGEKGLKLAEKNMRELVLLCNQHTVKLTIAVYPWPDQIRRQERESLQVKFWRDFAKKHNIGFIDFFPNFIYSKNSDEIIEKYFIPGDNHWNENGHALIAKELWKRIKGNVPELKRMKKD